MRKVLSVVICLTMLFAVISPSSADTSQNTYTEFTLRNGISFGMTLEEIQEREKSPVKRMEEKDKSWIEYYPVTIANIENCLIEYVVGRNNSLNTVWMNLCDRKANHLIVSNEYDNMNRALIEKYGAPLQNEDGELSIYGSRALKTLLRDASFYNDYKYDEWVFISDDGQYVITIDHYYSYMKGKNVLAVDHIVEYHRSELNKYANDI